MAVMDELRARSGELTNLSNILSLMHWDQEVMMPVGGTEDRASQLATLSRIIHKKVVSPHLAVLLQEAESSLDGLSLTEQALVRVMRREHDQNSKLPETFVAEFSSLTSQALPVWAEARRRSDFNHFMPHLEKIVAMCRDKADMLGYAERPYDALLDLHEEGLLASRVSVLFERIKPHLIELIQRREQSGLATVIKIEKEFEMNAQVLFSRKILEKIGYDFNRGREDQSVHPFSTSLGHNDRRVTNRYHPKSFEFIFSALHEGGHALYEQGVAEELAQSHLDGGISLGIHESQSRLWENIIGRSQSFWQHFFPALREAFPDQLADCGVDAFYREINKVCPDFIRVEADEVSYNLHVLIRFELEMALFDRSITVKDLPALWQEKYEEYLGLSFASLPDAAAKGVLQDIHWAHGSFGYFPTYTIGNLVASQFWEAYCRFDPSFEQTIAAGNLSAIREWLRDNIYKHGSVYPPDDLLRNVTGSALSEKPFLRYIHVKFGNN
jgi:carboxypeptidase Taq